MAGIEGSQKRSEEAGQGSVLPEPAWNGRTVQQLVETVVWEEVTGPFLPRER